jgi:gluconolactonase
MAGSVRQVKMADVYPTNIRFGGRDRKTAYITLSGSASSPRWSGPSLACASISRSDRY